MGKTIGVLTAMGVEFKQINPTVLSAQVLLEV